MAGYKAWWNIAKGGAYRINHRALGTTHIGHYGTGFDSRLKPWQYLVNAAYRNGEQNQTTAFHRCINRGLKAINDAQLDSLLQIFQ